MNIIVTFTTQRDYFQPMFWFVPFIVVIMFGLLATHIAFSCFNIRQFTINYCLINFSFCGKSFWIFIPMFFCVIFAIYLSFYCIQIFLYGFFMTISALFRMIVFIKFSFSLFTAQVFNTIFSTTSFTMAVISRFSILSCVKFRNQFNLLAFRTLFCLNCLSHSLISNIKSWLGPIARTTLALGSSYFTRKRYIVNYEY